MMLNEAFELEQDSPRKENGWCSGIKLRWNNVNVFSVPASRKFSCIWRCKTDPAVQILKNVNGEAKNGEILAIMGASGSGKTTLLNVLNQKNCEKFKVTGEITANNQKIDKNIVRVSAYVQQDDIFYPTITVREHLIFQAMLRMDRHSSYESRVQHVEKIMQDFGLKKCENTKIGGAMMQIVFKGISGGERKRLAIASEVLTNPSILYLDEPTSGLDSFMAESVIESLRNLTKIGKTVLCTIHQPSSQLFNKFDRLMLLADGRVAYLGTLDNAQLFFSECGIACPRMFNPADHYIYNLAVVPGQEQESRRNANVICDNFEASVMNPFKNLKMSENVEMQIQEDAIASQSMYKASWTQQFCTLLHRSFLNTTRTPLVTVVRIIQSVFIGLIIGTIYLNQKYDGAGIMNINGVCFLTLTQVSFPYLFGVLTTFCPELPIFLREHWNGMYRTDSYFLAKNLAEIPIITVSVILYCSISYWLIGLNSDPVTFCIFLAVSILIANTATSFGYVISCAASTPEMALSIGPPLLIPLMLFGGLFMNSASVPDYFVWLKYLSWFNYGYEIYMVNQWESIESTDCHLGKLNETLSIADLKKQLICPLSGESNLKAFSFEKENLTLDYSILVVLLVGYRLLAYLFLYLRARKKY